MLALDYAEKLAHSHHSMDDAYFDRLRTVFSDEQIVELGMLIGQFIGFGRLLAALDLEVDFAEGELMRTEVSCKYTRESVQDLLRQAEGFGLGEVGL